MIFFKLKCDWWCSYFDTTDDQTTVSYLLFPVIFFSSRNWFVRILKVYLRFILTVGQMTVNFFFRFVIFSGGSKNIAGQTTVPFFSGRNFFGS
jgi:hypothetical protein